MAKIDIEFIKKWVSITEEELMVRLVRDAIALQKEAEENCRLATIAERKSDPEYDIAFVKQFFKGYKYFSRYFSDKQILEVCKNNMSKSDLAEEKLIRGHHESYPYGRVLRYKRGKFTECRGSWERQVTDDGTVILVANQYQGVCGAAKVARDLIVIKCPWVAEYNLSIYEITDYGSDWIFVKTPDKVNNGSSTSSLYVPLSALFEKNVQKIITTHKNYWHEYGSGKYDAETDIFLASDFVKNFLKKAVK